jgi:hypothetical protein
MVFWLCLWLCAATGSSGPWLAGWVTVVFRAACCACACPLPLPLPAISRSPAAYKSPPISTPESHHLSLLFHSTSLALHCTAHLLPAAPAHSHTQTHRWSHERRDTERPGGGAVAAAAMAAPAPKQEELQAHAVRDQLPAVSYCLTSPPPWRKRSVHGPPNPRIARFPPFRSPGAAGRCA